MYYFLLIVTAVIAYGIGSLDTITMASLWVFKKNLRKLGRGNKFISNFWRVYKIKGVLKLLAVELVKDIVPIVIGGLLLSIKGHGDIGRIFAGFCLVLGRLWPVFYDLKGSNATLCLIVAAFFIDTSVGIATLIVAAVIIWFVKYLSLGTLAGALIMLLTTVLTADGRLYIFLALFIFAAILIKNIPALIRLRNGEETKLSFEQNLDYKFDQKFN